MTSPSRSYVRSVCACMPANWAATEIRNLWELSDLLMTVSSSRKRSSAVTRPSGPRVKPTGPFGRRVLLQRLQRSAFQIRWDRDLHGDKQVATAAVALGHAAATNPQDAPVGGALWHPDADLAIQRWH